MFLEPFIDPKKACFSLFISLSRRATPNFFLPKHAQLHDTTFELGGIPSRHSHPRENQETHFFLKVYIVDGRRFSHFQGEYFSRFPHGYRNSRLKTPPRNLENRRKSSGENHACLSFKYTTRSGSHCLLAQHPRGNVCLNATPSTDRPRTIAP